MAQPKRPIRTTTGTRMTKLLTAAEAAKLLHVSKRTVLRLLDEDVLPRTRIGRKGVRVTEHAVLAYLNSPERRL